MPRIGYFSVFRHEVRRLYESAGKKKLDEALRTLSPREEKVMSIVDLYKRKKISIQARDERQCQSDLNQKKSHWRHCRNICARCQTRS